MHLSIGNFRREPRFVSLYISFYFHCILPTAVVVGHLGGTHLVSGGHLFITSSYAVTQLSTLNFL